MERIKKKKVRKTKHEKVKNEKKTLQIFPSFQGRFGGKLLLIDYN